MNVLVAFVRAELWLFPAALTAVVIYQLLTGKINTSGLLSSAPADEGGAFHSSAGRLQLLIFTLAGAIIYLVEASESRTGLPDIPSWTAWMLAVSNGVYLGGKGVPPLADFVRRVASRERT